MLYRGVAHFVEGADACGKQIVHELDELQLIFFLGGAALLSQNRGHGEQDAEGRDEQAGLAQALDFGELFGFPLEESDKVLEGRESQLNIRIFGQAEHGFHLTLFEFEMRAQGFLSVLGAELDDAFFFEQGFAGRKLFREDAEERDGRVQKDRRGIACL